MADNNNNSESSLHCDSPYQFRGNLQQMVDMYGSSNECGQKILEEVVTNLKNNSLKHDSPVITRVLEVLNARLLPKSKTFYRIELAGSVTRGVALPRSDIDILLFAVENVPPKDWAKLLLEECKTLQVLENPVPSERSLSGHLTVDNQKVLVDLIPVSQVGGFIQMASQDGRKTTLEKIDCTHAKYQDLILLMKAWNENHRLGLNGVSIQPFDPFHLELLLHRLFCEGLLKIGGKEPHEESLLLQFYHVFRALQGVQGGSPLFETRVSFQPKSDSNTERTFYPTKNSHQLKYTKWAIDQAAHVSTQPGSVLVPWLTIHKSADKINEVEAEIRLFLEENRLQKNRKATFSTLYQFNGDLDSIRLEYGLTNDCGLQILQEFVKDLKKFTCPVDPNLILQQIRDRWISKSQNFYRAELSGSMSRGIALPGSDIDILVFINRSVNSSEWKNVVISETTQYGILKSHREQRVSIGGEFAINGQTIWIDLVPVASAEEGVIEVATQKGVKVEFGRLQCQHEHYRDVFLLMKAWNENHNFTMNGVTIKPFKSFHLEVLLHKMFCQGMARFNGESPSNSSLLEQFYRVFRLLLAEETLDGTTYQIFETPVQLRPAGQTSMTVDGNGITIEHDVSGKMLSLARYLNINENYKKFTKWALERAVAVSDEELSVFVPWLTANRSAEKIAEVEAAIDAVTKEKTSKNPASYFL